MKFRERGRTNVGFWAILLLGVFAWAPATYPGYWQGLEGFSAVFNARQPGNIARFAADADLWRGTGSAAYLLAQPLLMLGMPTTAAVRFLFALLLVLAGLSVYAWLEPRLGDRAAGLAGLLYMLMPPALMTIYVRGSLADMWIVALLPGALAATAAYRRTASPAAAALMLLAILWMWRIQAGLALFGTLLLLLYALLAERSRRGGLIVFVGGAAGFVSLLSLWSIRQPPPADFFQHFTYLFQLAGNRWITAPSIPGWQDELPLQIGFAAPVLGVIAFWLWRTRRANRADGDRNRLLAFAVTASVIILFLTLTPAAPLWRITGAHRLLTYPWQLTLLAGPFLIALAGSLPALLPSFGRVPYWPALIGVAILASYPYLTADFTQYPPPDRPYATLGARNEIVLLEATLTPLPDADQVRLDVTWQNRYRLDADYNIFLQAQVQEGEGYRSVAQLDRTPLDDDRPPTAWRPGKIMTAGYTLDLSEAGLDPAEEGLRFIFGYYDWRDGTRLPVDGGIDDKLIFYGR
ncbi:MAG: hypothetical protein H6642_06660 [Caldilineaceae bacterium]|nr:hypothetical protein [Caldilineaceae bacterium]